MEGQVQLFIMEQAPFWGLNKNLTWTKMCMVALNASLIFGAIISSLQHECQEEVEHQNIWEFLLELIMDDIVLFKILLATILKFLSC